LWYVGVELAEHVANGGAKEGEYSNNNNGNQHKNDGILDQALTPLTRMEQHGNHLLSAKMDK
jgi:hypothetical protein